MVVLYYAVVMMLSIGGIVEVSGYLVEAQLIYLFDLPFVIIG